MVHPGADLFVAVSGDFDGQQRFGVAFDEVGNPCVGQVRLRLTYDHGAYQLYGGGLAVEGHDGGLHRLDKVVAVEHAEAGHFGSRDQL